MTGHHLEPQVLEGVVSGDNLTVLSRVPDASVDLVYLDPPFFAQRRFESVSESGDRRGFDDRWASLPEYVDFMRVRVRELRRVLKLSGSMFLHCDPHASHYLRVMADEVFGEANFRNQIVWKRTGSHGSANKFGAIHDCILYYARSADHEWHGDPEHSDLWLDIQPLNARASERVAYPTQKPEALIARIIEAVTQPGDVVLDPFCGSGTTLVAAGRLGRRFLGIDGNADAISLATQRLVAADVWGVAS